MHLLNCVSHMQSEIEQRPFWFRRKFEKGALLFYRVFRNLSFGNLPGFLWCEAIRIPAFFIFKKGAGFQLLIIRLYVNSWGSDETQIIGLCRSKSLRNDFLCMAEQNPFPEIWEIPHTKADTLQNLCFVVAAFNEAICPGDIHGVQDFLEPVAICFGAVVEFRQIHDLDGCEPVNKFRLSDFRGIGAYYFEELVFQPIRIRKPGCYFKHEGQSIHFFIRELIHWLHQKISGFFEVFSESIWY